MKIILLALGTIGMVILIILFTYMHTQNSASKDNPTKGETIKSAIPESEILSGGPGKDGIPSIDKPVFVSIEKATFLKDDDFGIALIVGGDARFYPFQILVWHEIVNDTVGDIPVAVTYCPLCKTGVVYDRRVGDSVYEFGVSGKLWKSNLLMYNRNDGESLWSQVLGKAVTGPHTSETLTIVPSNTVRYGDWKKSHPDAKILSRDTGVTRVYGTDPYGDYYTNNDVSFGATFNDTRLHPKTYIIGIVIDGIYKAYNVDTLPVGTTDDTVASKKITITKSSIGEISIQKENEVVPFIGGFWFSWLAVHPNTLLWEK